MAYYKDLSVCKYFDGSGDYRYGFEKNKRLIAVGWIDYKDLEDVEKKGIKATMCDFSTGDVPKDFLDKLKKIAASKKEFMYYLGWHDCSVCPENSYRTPEDQMLYGEIFIPYQGRIYAAPNGIIHYIEKHHYLPPRIFIDAVMACREVVDKKYMDEIKKINAVFYEYLGYVSGETRDKKTSWQDKHQEITKKKYPEVKKKKIKLTAKQVIKAFGW